MGKGESNSGGRTRASNLADALEAMIGAAYLDGGTKAVEAVFKRLIVPEAKSLKGDFWEDNPKGELQELSQRCWKASPSYRIKRKEGPAHAAVFTVEVTVHNGRSATGKGANKQAAEAQAAGNLLKRLAGTGKG